MNAFLRFVCRFRRPAQILLRKLDATKPGGLYYYSSSKPGYRISKALAPALNTPGFPGSGLQQRRRLPLRLAARRQFGENWSVQLDCRPRYLGRQGKGSVGIS